MISEFESRFEALHEELRGSLRSDKHATIVSILSLHDDSAGQWIIGDTKQDPVKVAARLRVCADILDPPRRPACRAGDVMDR